MVKTTQEQIDMQNSSISKTHQIHKSQITQTKGRPLHSQQSSNKIKKLLPQTFIQIYFLTFYENVQIPKGLVFQNTMRKYLLKKYPNLIQILRKQDLYHYKKVNDRINQELTKSLFALQTNRLQGITNNNIQLLFKNCCLKVAEIHSQDVLSELFSLIREIFDIVTLKINDSIVMKQLLRNLAERVANADRKEFIFLGFKFILKPQLTYNKIKSLFIHGHLENQYILNQKYRELNGQFAKLIVNVGLFVKSLIQDKIKLNAQMRGMNKEVNEMRNQ